MKVINVKMINKGALICRFDIEFEEWGLTIRECTLLTGQNGKWVGLPSRQYEDKATNQKKYYNLVVFDKDKKKRLDGGVILRLKDYLTPSALETNNNEPEPVTDMF